MKKIEVNSLSHYDRYLTEVELEEIAQTISTESCINSLVIDSKINGCGIAALIRTLKFNESLTEIQLPGNAFDEHQAKLLLQALCSKPNLSTFSIQEAFLDMEGSAAVVDFITSNEQTLTDLSVGVICIDDARVNFDAIPPVLARNTTLTRLNCSGSQASLESLVYFGDLLAVNSCLTDLNIGFSSFFCPGTDEAAERLYSHFSHSLGMNSTLTKLNMECMRFHSVGAKYIADALQVNSTLTYLDINTNDIFKIGGEYIFNAIEANLASSLTYLNIRCNYFDEVWLREWVKKIESNTSLTSLIVSHCSDEFLSEIATWLERNKRFQEERGEYILK